MRNNTYRIALGGILSATVLALMMMGSLIPFGTFAVPALASLVIAIINEEDSPALAVCVWLVVGLLSVLLGADKEAAMLFICFFGHYPILKAFFESKLGKVSAFILKSLCFLVSVGGAYWLMLKVFALEAVAAEFSDYREGFALILLALGFLVFLMLDLALSRVLGMWRRVLRPRFIRK